MPPDDDTCLVDGKIIVLVEHLSTVNANMPLRFLQYVARLTSKSKRIKPVKSYIGANRMQSIRCSSKPYAGIRSATAKGAYQAKLETAKLMRLHKYPVAEISMMIGLAKEEIERL